MLTEDRQNDEDALELNACYRGWLRHWPAVQTAGYYSRDYQFVALVSTALDQRWPGMARRRRAALASRCTATGTD